MNSPVIDDAVLSDGLRLAAVRRVESALAAATGPPDAAAHLAARVVGAPIGLVTLVRGQSIYCAGLFGAPDELMWSRELPLTGTLCPLVTGADRPLVVDDALTHPEFAGFEAVVRYQVRGYLGVPLHDRRGRVLGAVSAVDTRARRWTGDDVTALLQLAEMLGPLPEGDPLTDHHGGAATVLDALGVPLIALDQDGWVSEWNTAAAQMFGWSPAEAFGRPVEQLMLADGEWTRIRAATGAESTGPVGSPWRQLITARHRAGHSLPVEIMVTALPTPAAPSWAMVVFDGAERAAADRLYARRDGLLHAVLDSLHVPVVACDAGGQVMLFNRALRRAHGLPGDDAPIDFAAIAAQLFKPDGAPLTPAEIPMTLALRGTPVRDTEVIIRAEGRPPRTFTANAEPLRDPDGTIAGGVVALHDVTGQRRAERFRDCELEVVNALSGAGEVGEVGLGIARAVAQTLRWPYAELWLYDPVTDTMREAGRWLSPGVHVDYPMTAPVVRGHGVTGTVWATGRPLWIPDMADTATSRSPVAPALAAACAQAGLHTAVAVPVYDGTMVGVLACIADHCEYDEAEIISGLSAVAGHIGRFISRHHTEGLATQLDRTRDDFIALVGHEMRTPLTSIGSYVQLLLADDDLAPELQQILGVVDRNTAALTAIVDDLLDLAALQSGHATMHRRPTDVTALVRDGLTAVAPAAEANDVTFDVDMPDRMVIDADPERLRQVIDNLLSNAVKYSPDGGTATVRLHTDTATDSAVLSVSDSGIGVPAEDRTNLFRTFFRAGNARHTAIAGTGLGLVITRAIVEAHNGVITAAHDDPGTTIVVRLPATAGDSG